MVDSVAIRSARRFRIGDRSFEVEEILGALVRDRGKSRLVGPGEARRLATALEEQLYRLAYARLDERAGRRLDPLAWREHIGRLTTAWGGGEIWRSGWRLRGRDRDGGFTVEAHGVVFRVDRDRLRPEGDSLALGSSCQVRVPKGMLGIVPGFYLLEGRAAQSGESPWVTRLYWHLEPAGAPRWLEALATRLDARRIPFQLKVATARGTAHRSDAGVLYLEPHHYRRARPIVRAVHVATREHLLPEPPRLTRCLAPGLGVAEGPVDGSSFGHHRCRLVARALVGAFESGRDGTRPRRRAVAEAFRRAGLDPRRPHLAAGSSYRYHRLESGVQATRRPAKRTATTTTPTPLEAAAKIGDVLCRTAWHGDDRCNWLGGAAVGRDRELGEPIPAIAALDADLYGGTSGVALFLAELHARIGGQSVRDTAFAALRQATHAVAREAGRHSPLGFHSGRLGIAWAARRAARALAEPGLERDAESVLRSLADGRASGPPLDLIHGSAGAIPALLGLHAETGSRRYLGTAVALGDEMLRHAAQAEGRTTWANAVLSASQEDDPPLTGLAHGVAGPGLALLELAAVTGRGDFRQAGRGAFAYEMTTYDVAKRNWPDLRGAAARTERDPAARPRFMTAWCHGAPGIALARLRALEVDPAGAGQHEPAARSGLRTTLGALARDLVDGSGDTSLCHGVCGLVEIALYGARVLDDEASRRVALAALDRLLERHARSADWPSGEPYAAPNPSLMLGLAGVGYTLLRVEGTRRPPSVLLLEPPRGEDDLRDP